MKTTISLRGKIKIKIVSLLTFINFFVVLIIREILLLKKQLQDNKQILSVQREEEEEGGGAEMLRPTDVSKPLPSSV